MGVRAMIDLDALAADATPGRWVSRPYAGPRDDTLVYAVDGDLAVAVAETPSDAALIVAAPELVAALLRVRALVMDTDGGWLSGEDFDGLAGAIQEAIAPVCGAAS